MAGGGTNSSMRKYLGSIKDTTTISLAKVNSDNKRLDIAVVRATNHVERPAKEKHIRAMFAAVSANRPRPDVAYCIHALSRRLSKTHNWAVALKTLIVIHRALREVDHTFRDELINYGRSRSHMLNMSHFRDDSSASAWDYSAWIRAYALFLEEKLECFRVLKYDVELEPTRTKDVDTTVLLEQLPALQQLLFRVLGCQPEGAAVHNHVIQLALSMVATESIKIYNAISDGSVNLVDKFFEMQRHDATRALDIYRRAGQQAERLAEFYEVCKNLDFGRGDKFIKIEQPPASFLQAMEEYVSEAPRGSTFRKEQVKQVVDEKPTVMLTMEDKEVTDVKMEKPLSPSLPEQAVKEEKKQVIEAPDLLSFDDPPVASDLNEKNAMALAIVPIDDLSTTTAVTQAPSLANGRTGWELALVTAPVSNETTTSAAPQLAGALDKLTLDSLYEDAIRRSNQPTSYNPWEAAPFTTNPMMQAPVHNPFMGSNGLVSVAPPAMQMAAMANQQQAFMYQHPMMMMMGPQQHQLQPPQPQQQLAPTVTNPFSSPYAPNIPVQTYNPYATGL